MSSANFEGFFVSILFVFCKKLFFQVERKFLWNIIIWYDFSSKFSTSIYLETIHIFFKKRPLFFLKNHLSYNSRNLTISVAFYVKIATIWWSKTFKFGYVGHRTFSIVKTVKKLSISAFGWMIFPAYYQYRRKIIKVKLFEKELNLFWLILTQTHWEIHLIIFRPFL